MRFVFAADPINRQASRRDIAAIIFLLLALLAAGVGASVAHAAPAHIQAEAPNARLTGKGDFRWLGLKIYSAEFWVGDSGYRAAAPTAARFALDLRYARAGRRQDRTKQPRRNEKTWMWHTGTASIMAVTDDPLVSGCKRGNTYYRHLLAGPWRALLS